MFARLSAWITARSVLDASRGCILALAPQSVLRASGDWLDELTGALGPIARGADPEAVAIAALARLAKGVDAQARRRSLTAWQHRQAGAREAVVSRIQALLSAPSKSQGG